MSPMKTRLPASIALLGCAALLLTPGVEGKGKSKTSAKDPKGDIAKGAPSYMDIVKVSGKKAGRNLVNKIKVRGTLPKDIGNLPNGQRFILTVSDKSGGTSYFYNDDETEGVNVKRQGGKTLKFVLEPKAVGSGAKTWAVFADAGSRDDRAPNRDYTYLKYK